MTVRILRAISRFRAGFFALWAYPRVILERSEESRIFLFASHTRGERPTLVPERRVGTTRAAKSPRRALDASAFRRVNFERTIR
jgi:hypothetical protein